MASFAAFRTASLRLASARSPPLHHRLLSTLSLYRTQRPQLLDTRWRNTRWNSTAAVPPATTLAPPPPPLEQDLVSAGTELLPDLETIASMPPLQHGDLQALGFCHWTPAGLVQYTFELTHVLTGLPWFYTFIAATVFWRLVLFPFTVVGMRNSTRLKPINAAMAANNAQLVAARATGNTMEVQRIALQAKKLREEAGVSMAGLLAPLIQFPVSIGMFFGIKKMCDLPVLQLTQSGFDLIPDLTAPGPFLLLPVLVAISGNVMISVGKRDMDRSRPMIGHVMNMFRVVSFLGVWWMATFPSGLLLSLFVTSSTAVLQALLFRVPSVRAALDIPPWEPMPGPEPPNMRETFRYFFIKGAQSRASGDSAAVASAVPHYVPPNAVSLKMPPLKMPAPPVPSAAQQQRPRTLDMLAKEAQARASEGGSGLYEAPAAAPAKPAASKKAKAPKKSKASKSA